MKSIIQSLLLVLLLSGVNELHADNPKTITRIEHAGAKSIAVYIEFPVATNAELSIRDENGVLVFSEVYRNVTVFAKKIDLINLPKGIYSLEVEGPQKIHVYGVRLSDEQLLIDGGKPKVFFKPAFIYKNGNLDVNMLLLQVSKTTVEIFSPDGDLLLSEVFENTKTLEKRFDVSKLKAGDYSVVVSADGRQFSYKMTIR